MIYLFFVILMFFGSIMQMVTGLGLPIVAMIALPFIVSYQSSLAIVSLVNLGHALIALLTGEREIDYKKCIVVTAVYFAASTVAVRFMSGQSMELMMRLMGAVLIMIGLYFIFFNRNLSFDASMTGNIITGIACGIMGALFGFFGPPLSIYYLATSKSTVEYQSNMRFTYLFTAVYTVWLRISAGYMTQEVIRYGIVSIAALSVGVLFGNRYLKDIRGDKLRLGVYWALIFCGAVYLIKGG